MSRGDETGAAAVVVSFVVPLHNEAGNCGQLVDEIAAAAGELGVLWEIVCVDDASDDNTASLLKEKQQTLPALRLILLAENCGQSTALQVGVSQARGRIIVTLDGDGQNDPADAPAMVRLLEEKRETGVRMVAGWRQQRRDTLWRRLSSRIANGVRRFLLRDNTPDTGCGLKVFDREIFMAMPWFDHMHRFLPALVRRAGGEVMSVAVGHRPRRHGASHYGTWDRLRVGIVDLLGVAWLQRRNRLPIVSEYRGDQG